MGSRSFSLRTKVVALLTSLAALWGFAAWVTVPDALNLLGVRQLDTRVFAPTEPLLAQLQLERRTSLVYLGRPRATQREELAKLRERTDRLAAEFAESADSWPVGLFGGDALHDRIARLKRHLSELPETRTAIDERNIGRGEAGAVFTALIDSIYQVYDELGNLDDDRIVDDTAQLHRLNRARELLSQEDALLAGVLAAGRITSVERAEFTRVVGARQFVADQAIVRLPEADQRRYEQLVTGSAFRRLADLENRVMTGSGTSRVPLTASEWSDATGAALVEIGDVVVAAGDDIVSNATPVAIGVIVRLVLVAGLGLLVVIASVLVSITTARDLRRQSRRLRDAAYRFADERLPSVADRLGRGEQVDTVPEPPPSLGDGEIAEVGRAFDAVRTAAVRTVAEQVELRRTTREVSLNLARRTQTLAHRQLTLLDSMERRERDAEKLEDLFRVDHLATRMRRHAENLIVLSGATPGRAWRRGVAMLDVIRGAVGEVEDYSRVTVHPVDAVAVAGRAVGDVIHLLAELIENGLSFSPSYTGVEVRGQVVANGFAVEIEDRGLGIPEAERAAANHRLLDRAELGLPGESRLGLYVVSRLAARHDIRVRLKESAYGGTTAVVLLPSDLLVADGAEPDGTEPDGGGDTRAETPADAAEPTAPTAAPNTAPVDLADPATPTEGPEPDVGAYPADADRAGPQAPPVDEAELPTRSRHRPAYSSALDGPTVPIGLPLTSRADSTVDPGAGAVGETELSRTESGLPVRVRQASLAPALRAGTEAVDDDDDVVREPERVRRMMSSYQTGTRRGRSDAARLLGAGGRPGLDEGPDDADQQGT